MKAVYIEQFGGPEVVKYGDLPDRPLDRARSSSMRLRQASTAPIWKVRAGHHKQASFPWSWGAISPAW